MTVEQAGQILGLSRTAAYEAVKRGQIPSVRLGRRILIPRGKLSELLGRDDEAGRAAIPPELHEAVRHLDQNTQLLAHAVARIADSVDKLEAIVSKGVPRSGVDQ